MRGEPGRCYQKVYKRLARGTCGNNSSCNAYSYIAGLLALILAPYAGVLAGNRAAPVERVPSYQYG